MQKSNKRDYSTIPTCPKSHVFPKHKHVLIVDDQMTNCWRIRSEKWVNWGKIRLKNYGEQSKTRWKNYDSYLKSRLKKCIFVPG